MTPSELMDLWAQSSHSLTAADLQRGSSSRLKPRGREIVPLSSVDELLFRRFEEAPRTVRDLQLPDVLGNDYSMNRGRFSIPTDVLGKLMLCCACISVGEFNKIAEAASQGLRYRWMIEHSISSTNYSHVSLRWVDTRTANPIHEKNLLKPGTELGEHLVDVQNRTQYLTQILMQFKKQNAVFDPGLLEKREPIDGSKRRIPEGWNHPELYPLSPSPEGPKGFPSATAT